MNVNLVYASDSDYVSKKKKEVIVLLSSSNPIYEEGLIGLRSILSGEMKIEYIDNVDGDDGQLEEFFKEISLRKPDLVITFGTSAAQSARHYLSNTPLLFSMLANPKSLNLGNGKICGVTSDVPVSDFFQTLKDIRPNSNRVLSFYSDKAGEEKSAEGEYTDLKYNLLFTRKRLEKSDDFRKALELYAKKTDAFLMINDPLYNSDNFSELSNFCKNNGIILMTGYNTLLKAGATFSISPDYNKLGIKTGELAVRILDGNAECNLGPFVSTEENLFSVNEKFAEESKIPIPQNILDRAKFSKIFSEGAFLLNTGKVKSARNIFQALYKRDPNNKTLKEFLQKTNEKVSGTEINKLLQQATEHSTLGNHKKATELFKKILALNSDHIEAKMGYDKSLHAQSDQEMNEGLKNQSAGRIFEAYRKIRSALNIYPKNLKAQEKANAIRANEVSKVSEYMKKGSDLYNRREYKEALLYFEHIALLQPDHKEAKEYIRISMKKEKSLSNHIECSAQKSKKCYLLWKNR